MTSLGKQADHFRRRIDTKDLLNRGRALVLFAILLVPSVWMLSAVPPLWRDVDAYIQLTRPPGFETILQYGPTYCFVARIALYFGYATDCLRAGAPLPTLSFFAHPILSDSGVFLLLLSQNLSLCFASFHLIARTTRLFWVRWILAAAWAANPLFYTFAHCVGGETLSLILVLLIGATGLKIIQHYRTIPKIEWILFGVLLWLCILTRQINAALAAVLPLTFVLLTVWRLIGTRFARSQSVRRWNRLRWQQAFQNATIGVVIGISCIILANASLRALCYAANIPYRSVVGLAFLGRLKFLAVLPIEQRNQLLDQAKKNAGSTDVKNLIYLLRNEFTGGTASWDIGAFQKSGQGSLFPPQGDPAEQHRFDVALNRLVMAFLCPPEKIFLRAVATDFKKSQQITIPGVVGFLFVTTRFYFSHRDVMPQCASLITFRDKNADRIFAVFKNHSYFRDAKNVSYRAFLFIWILLFAAFLLIAKIRKRDIAGAASNASALIVIGILMMLANCFLAIFQPRYTLPMWELTLVSLSILFGGMMETLLHPSCPLRSPKVNDQTKRSDHLHGS
jgi:hypothetical protein